MLPIFVFIALPTLSVALLLAVICRRLSEMHTHAHYRKMRRAMSRLEALQLLGLDRRADPRSIRAAYKRLMVKYHPDHGGSNQAAALLNLARDTLLRSRKTRVA